MAVSVPPRDIISANRLELLQIADSVAREKSVDRATVFAAIEETIAKAMRSRYGAQQDIRAHIDADSGEIRVYRYREIVEEIEEPATQMTLSEARLRDPNASLGDYRIEELPLSELERSGSQAGKQVMHQKVREAERKGQYEEFKDRVGDIITGTVKLVERGNVIVDIQRGEATMRRDQAIPRENFRIGDRIRALIIEVQNENPGPQILLSRSSPEYMLRLFAQEVPEVYDGVIEIRAIARDPGSRAKIAVISNNSSIDPVGACVGMRGSRVQTIVNELHGERIDVIPWSSDPEVFITASLQPARVVDVILSREAQRAEVIVPDEDDNQSKAIGRRGQNVRLASKLTDWHIDILTEEMYSERETTERAKRIAEFVERLGIDEHDAMILSAAGLHSLLDIAEIDLEELNMNEGISPSQLAAIQDRARQSLAQEMDARIGTLRDLGMEDALIEYLTEAGLPIEAIEAVANHEDRSKAESRIRTLRQFADLNTDELCGEEIRVGGRIRRRVGILSRFAIDEDDAGTIIMHARIQLGDFTVEQVFGTSEEAAGPPDEPDSAQVAEESGVKIAATS